MSVRSSIMPKLTKSFIDKYPVPISKDKFEWDTELKGFGIRVTPKGRVSFIVQNRVNGRSERITIGQYGVFAPDQARDIAREHLRTMRMGTSPTAQAKAHALMSITLREVCDSYIKDRSLKASSQSEIRRHVTTSFEAWQDTPIAAINREDVNKRYNQLKEHGLRGNAPAPAQANQAFSVLRALINYAMDEYRKEDGTPLIQENPVNILKKKMVKLKPRTSRIPDSKVNDVWKYLWSTRETAFNRETLASIDLIIFLMLTGARLGEARSLTWDRVNLEEAWWHIPDPKNHNPVYLPLSTQAIELLKARPRTEGSPFVFASWSKSGHIIDPRDSLKRMSEVAGTPITAHDLRRTFTTIGVAHCGIDLNKVELLTNHVPKGVTAIHYLETTHLQYLRPEVQQVADWIDKSKS